MIRFWISVISLLLSAPASAVDIERPNPDVAVGNTLPAITLTDDKGQPVSLESLRGAPLVINPVFTGCKYICPMITTNLAEPLLELGNPGRFYNVLTVTFDDEDDDEDLSRFKQTNELPEGWIVARGDTADVAALLRALDFRFVKLEPGVFAHPNAVAFANGDLEVTGFVNGVVFEDTDVRRALDKAAGNFRHVSSRDPRLLFIMLGSAVALAGFLLVYSRKRPRPSAG